MAYNTAKQLHIQFELFTKRLIIMYKIPTGNRKMIASIVDRMHPPHGQFYPKCLEHGHELPDEVGFGAS
jgi:hypothetical protein